MGLLNLLRREELLVDNLFGENSAHHGVLETMNSGQFINPAHLQTWIERERWVNVWEKPNLIISLDRQAASLLVPSYLIWIGCFPQIYMHTKTKRDISKQSCRGSGTFRSTSSRKIDLCMYVGICIPCCSESFFMYQQPLSPRYPPPPSFLKVNISSVKQMHVSVWTTIIPALSSFLSTERNAPSIKKCTYWYEGPWFIGGGQAWGGFHQHGIRHPDSVMIYPSGRPRSSYIAQYPSRSSVLGVLVTWIIDSDWWYCWRYCWRCCWWISSGDQTW